MSWAACFFWAALLQAQAESTGIDGTPLVLDGVIVAANPVDSVALVRRAGAARARILRVGQEIHGWVLMEVDRDSVRLKASDADLRLFLGGARESSPAAIDPAPPPSAASSADEKGWIRRSFPRASARERLSREIPVILSETDLTPRIEDGEVKGLSVGRLPDGTLLSETGLLPGDVLVSINGEPLRGVEALWELVRRLGDEDEIRVVVERRGEELRLAYALTN